MPVLRTLWPVLCAALTLGSGAALAADALTKPNILLIVADDLGYSDLGSYGGEIHTPSLDQLAREGLQFTSLYAAPTCSITRSMLLSGTDNHLVGLGTMAEALRPFQRGKPGYEGYLNQRAWSVAELLQHGGYHTLMAGKWHLGLDADQGPDRRGFAQSFSLLEGGATHFKPQTVDPTKIEQVHYRENGQPVQVPEDFYSTDFYTDKLIGYLHNVQQDGKPFFAYAAYTSPHWPLQAPQAYLDKYRGRFDEGYDSVRLSRIERMKKLGLLAADTQPAQPLPVNPKLPGWEQLSPEQRKVAARKMEIYAAMVDNLDANIGRLLDYLRQSGQYDNTLIVFMSDNGAAGENHAQFYPPGPRTDNSLRNLGRAGSQIDYGLRWAEVSATPFHLFKGTTAEGGISVPAIIQLPKALRRQGIERGVARVDDLAPTFLEIAGIAVPDEAGKQPITGRSLMPMLAGEGSPHVAGALAGELFGNAYYREGDLKLLGMRPQAGMGDAAQPVQWQLFDVALDRGETTDLAATQPQTVERLKAAWMAYARRVGVVFPGGD
ncbi:arylsulfatase [Pseudomonas moraviensis subsp. stanleyae]|uniref:arylsulfatase n=1 Tax=Pseudomonas moraviensis TaxID=321662 RepID=UPI002E2EF902|nr:arylsulfatase [Pseudomonas moraviensis]MED7669798.1 arylsulfatase [Pseudomonas moraviensis subsp. stanleyae]